IDSLASPHDRLSPRDAWPAHACRRPVKGRRTLVGLGLMIYSHFFGPIGIMRPRSSLREVTAAVKGAAVPTVIPVIIMGGILSGLFTPTEAGVVAVAYILVVAITLINRGYLRQLPHDMAMTGLLYSFPLIAIAAASAI